MDIIAKKTIFLLFTAKKEQVFHAGIKSIPAQANAEQTKWINAYRLIIKLFNLSFFVKYSIKHAISGNNKIKLIIIVVIL